MVLAMRNLSRLILLLLFILCLGAGTYSSRKNTYIKKSNELITPDLIFGGITSGEVGGIYYWNISGSLAEPGYLSYYFRIRRYTTVSSVEQTWNGWLMCKEYDSLVDTLSVSLDLDLSKAELIQVDIDSIQFMVRIKDRNFYIGPYIGVFDYEPN